MHPLTPPESLTPDEVADGVRQIPVEVANHVVWHVDRTAGYEPGAFFSTLLDAFAKADPQNFVRLGRAFPDYGNAAYAAARVPGGMDALRRRAGGDL